MQQSCSNESLLDDYLNFDGDSNAPERILNEIVEGTRPIQCPNKLKVRIESEIDTSLRVKYDWNVYSIIAYHLHLSAMYSSKSRNILYWVKLDITIDKLLQTELSKIEAFQLLRDFTERHNYQHNYEVFGGASSFLSDLEKDASKAKKMKIYLNSIVIFQSCREKQPLFREEDDPQKQQRKATEGDSSYQLLQSIVKLYGGKVFFHFGDNEGLSMIQVILPMNYETVHASVKTLIQDDIPEQDRHV